MLAPSPEPQPETARPPDHPEVAHGRIGVLLVNLGSPDAPTPEAVVPYLRQFLSDPRVIELPRRLWRFLLERLILKTRPPRTAAAYAAIWDEAEGDSPLRAITRRQARALSGTWGDRVEVDFAMRYGTPAIPERLDALRAAGCDRILVAPLYPQYSSATTGTAVEAVFRHVETQRWVPAIRTLPPYYDHPAYIAALAGAIRRELAGLAFAPERLILSFHGMPRRTLELGDPYHCQCRKTARLLADALDWPQERLLVTFQSRFGPAEWLQPYTEPALVGLARSGIRQVAVACPGFSADCLETLEEIAIEARDAFLAAGGTDYAYLSCLNDSPEGMAMLRAILSQELAGWVAAD